MANFRVTFEIEVDTPDPLSAAKEVQDWMRSDDWQFYVQNTETNEIFSVDLQEEDEDAVIQVEKYEPLIQM